MTLRRFSEMQLEFDLELDEVEADAAERAITAEEARQISEAARQAFDRMRAAQRDTEGGWFDDYLALIEKGWPWRVATYIAWASSPRDGRWPRTLRELAEQVLGLASPRVIYHWRKKHATIDTVVAMMQASVLWAHRRDVFEALVEMAKQSDYKSFNDRKLFLEMVGDYTPKSKLELGKAAKGDLEEMSDDELREWTGTSPTESLSVNGEGENEEEDNAIGDG